MEYFCKHCKKKVKVIPSIDDVFMDFRCENCNAVLEFCATYRKVRFLVLSGRGYDSDCKTCIARFLCVTK